MSEYRIQSATLTGIADAIRNKKGTSALITPEEMATEIESISTSGTSPTGTKSISITENGTTTEDVSSYASAEITVNVPTSSTPEGTKTINITENGTTTEDVTNYATVEVIANVASSGGSGLDWQTINIVGNDNPSISIPIVADTNKSYFAFMETTEQVENTYNPTIIRELYSWNYIPKNKSQTAAWDSSGASRTPTASRTASAISFSTTRNFSSDFTYVLHYAEFDI